MIEFKNSENIILQSQECTEDIVLQNENSTEVVRPEPCNYISVKNQKLCQRSLFFFKSDIPAQNIGKYLCQITKSIIEETLK